MIKPNTKPFSFPPPQSGGGMEGKILTRFTELAHQSALYDAGSVGTIIGPCNRADKILRPTASRRNAATWASLSETCKLSSLQAPLDKSSSTPLHLTTAEPLQFCHETSTKFSQYLFLAPGLRRVGNHMWHRPGLSICTMHEWPARRHRLYHHSLDRIRLGRSNWNRVLLAGEKRL
jgi:hypothetical protein